MPFALSILAIWIMGCAINGLTKRDTRKSTMILTLVAAPIEWYFLLFPTFLFPAPGGTVRLVFQWIFFIGNLFEAIIITIGLSKTR